MGCAGSPFLGSSFEKATGLGLREPPLSGFVLIHPYAHLLSQVWPVSKPGRSLGDWHSWGAGGQGVSLESASAFAWRPWEVLSLSKDELRDHTGPVGLPRPQSHTSTSEILTRASSSFCSNPRAACSSVIKPRVMLRPLLP